jgi:cohesin complex subunit SCC1
MQAFRLTNNNDLPSTIALPPGGITLPDVLTEADLFMNMDTSLLFSQPLHLEPEAKRPNSSLGLTSEFLPWDSTPTKAPKERPHLEDDTGLVLDLGEDEDIPLDYDMSIEVGRDAPAPRPVGEDLFSDDNKLLDDDLDLDFGDDGLPLDKMSVGDPRAAHDNLNDFLQQDDDIEMGGVDEVGAHVLEDSTVVPAKGPGEVLRESQSPLSSARSSVVRDLGDSFVNEAIRQPQRVKRRKLIQPDVDTVLSSHQIKEQQADRSKILKPASFLPRDPLLLALITMQKNGGFVSSVMGGDGNRSWAPELRDMLSIDSVRKSGELKRKRDSGIADMDVDEVDKVPQLDLGEEEDLLPVDEGVGLGGESTLNHRSEIHLPGDFEERGRSPHDDSDDEGMDHHIDDYDDTTVLVHPADSGPISLGTRHAVHLLRDRFGGSASVDGSSQQKKAGVFFQDLLPEQQTSKTDATKMFFEVLVLATKDAVKVEQSSNTIGGRLRIRAKPALWGSWAETKAGGEIATQEAEVAA